MACVTLTELKHWLRVGVALQHPIEAPSTNNKAAAGSGTVALDMEPAPTVRPKWVRHAL